MRTSDKSSDNELQQKTTSNNEWQRMTNNENEIQRVTGIGITNEKGWEQKNRVILSFKVKQNMECTGSWRILFNFFMQCITTIHSAI